MIPYNIFQTAYMAPDIEAVVALATRRLGSPRMHGRADVQLTISAFSLDLAAPGIGFESFPGLQIFGYPLRPTCTCRIDIVKANPAAPPRIRPNYLATEHNRRITIDMVRLMRRMATAASLAAVIERETFPADAMPDEDEAIVAATRRDQSCAHAVGTCQIGTDDRAVVDPRLRVHELNGLRVMDCSVMPTQVSGNSNVPVMTMAVHAARIIAEDGRA